MVDNKIGLSLRLAPRFERHLRYGLVKFLLANAASNCGSDQSSSIDIYTVQHSLWSQMDMVCDLRFVEFLGSLGVLLSVAKPLYRAMGAPRTASCKIRAEGI